MNTSAFEQISVINAQLPPIEKKARPLQEALARPPDADIESVEAIQAEIDDLRGQVRRASSLWQQLLAPRSDAEALKAKIAAALVRLERAQEGQELIQLGRAEIETQLNELSVHGQELLRQRAKLGLAAMVEQAEIAAADYAKAARTMAEARARVQCILEIRAEAQRDAARARRITEAEEVTVSPEVVGFIDLPGFSQLEALGGSPHLVVAFSTRNKGHIVIDTDTIRADLKAGFQKLGLLS